MLQNDNFSNLNQSKKFLHTYHKSIIVGTVILIVFALLLANRFSKANDGGTTELNKAQTVRTMQVGSDSGMPLVEAIGQVVPENVVEVITLTRGSVRSASFSLGDQVRAGQTLAELYDATVMTNLQTAASAYNSAQVSYTATINLAEQSVKQAEMQKQSAQTAAQNAQIAYVAAKDNYDKALLLQPSAKVSLQKSAVTLYGNCVALSYNILDQINYLIKAQGNNQNPLITNVLGVLNPLSVTEARNAYDFAYNVWSYAATANVQETNVVNYLPRSVQMLEKTDQALDKTLLVLNNTVSSADFPEAALSAEKQKFLSLKNTLAANYTSAKEIMYNLQNIDLNQSREAEQLKASLDVAEKQVSLAQLAVQSADTALTSARSGREQSLASAGAALSGANGQYSLTQTQYEYLTISAPIAGKINYKNAPLGQEIGVGYKIAEIVNDDLLKVVIDVTPKEAALLQVGQEAFVDGNIPGTVAQISSHANEASHKVRVEIAFEKSAVAPRINESVNVAIIVAQPVIEETYFIPLRALLMGQTSNFVYVVEDGRAVKRQVSIVSLRGVEAEVAGLLAGEELIIENTRLLNDGDTVQILE